MIHELVAQLLAGAAAGAFGYWCGRRQARDAQLAELERVRLRIAADGCPILNITLFDLAMTAKVSGGWTEHFAGVVVMNVEPS